MRKFKYAPKGIPVIKMSKKEFEEWERKIKAPPTEKQKAIWREAEEVFNKIKHVETQSNCVDLTKGDKP